MIQESLARLAEICKKADGVTTENWVEIREHLMNIMTYLQISILLKNLESATGNEKPKNEVKPETSGIETLSKIAATRTINGKREFLLHRATEDHEYAENTHDNEFQTKKETTWFPEYMTEQNDKDGANPVVSCWIPEAQIKIPEPHINTGVWGELGKNPHAARFEVIVLSGRYQIHQEYKGA